MSILKQAQFLDIVNGTRGIIVCQDLSSSKPYIQMTDENENQRQFDMKEVVTINSYENSNYDPMCDIIIKGQEVYVNRHEAHAVECAQRNDRFTVTKDSLANIPQLDYDAIGGELVIELSKLTDNTRVSLLPITDTEKKGKTIFYIIPNSLFADGYVNTGSQSVSVNNTLRLVYKVKKGLYAFYVSEKKKFYFCEVK